MKKHAEIVAFVILPILAASALWWASFRVGGKTAQSVKREIQNARIWTNAVAVGLGNETNTLTFTGQTSMATVLKFNGGFGKAETMANLTDQPITIAPGAAVTLFPQDRNAHSIAIGPMAMAGYSNSIVIGAGAEAHHSGELVLRFTDGSEFRVDLPAGKVVDLRPPKAWTQDKP